MTWSSPTERPNPLLPLQRAMGSLGAIILVLILLWGLALRVGGQPAEGGGATAAVVTTQALHFLDQPDGSIAVLDVVGRQVGRVSPGEDGFVRGTLRGFARERRAHGVGAEPPFTLTLFDDGGLILADPKTGRRTDLGAFGPTNRGAFARFLTNPEGQP